MEYLHKTLGKLSLADVSAVTDGKRRTAGRQIELGERSGD